MTQINKEIECRWDKKNNQKTWERMYKWAVNPDIQWISIDIDPNNDRSPLNVIGCAGCGCYLPCPLVPNIVALLVQNKSTQKICIGVAIKLELSSSSELLTFENENKEITISFYYPPPINSRFFNHNDRIINQITKLAPGVENSYSNIVIKFTILRDTSTSLNDFSKCEQNNWDNVDDNKISTMKLYSITSTNLE